MKRVLVTGGALGDVPIIKALKEEGHFVVTSGNKSEDIGHTYSDEYIPCDYTDVEKLVQIIQDLGCDAIIPSAHDLAAIAASKVAKRLSLPGYDNPEISTLIHNKDQLRQALALCDVQQPKFWLLKSELDLQNHDSWEFPVIVKPVDLTGGNGIRISRDLYSLREAFTHAQSASPSGHVIVEEYLKGSYHGLTTIIRNQKVEFAFADNEFFLFDPYRVSATTFPSCLTVEKIETVTRMISDFAKNYKLVDGLLHVQLILSEDEVYILEICRRTPGDLYPYFVELATKCRYSQLITLPFLGGQYHSPINQLDPGSESSVARFMLMPSGRGTFYGIEDEFKRDYDLVFEVLSIGAYVDEPRKQTLAIYFLSDSLPISKETILTMKDKIRANVQSHRNE